MGGGASKAAAKPSATPTRTAADTVGTAKPVEEAYTPVVAPPPAPPPEKSAMKSAMKKQNSAVRFATEADEDSKRDESRKASPRNTKTDSSADAQQTNDAEIFRVSAAVYENRVNAMAARSLVQENSALINKNYSSAFNGNRQLVIQNTDDLFRNRLAVLGSWKVAATTPTQAAYAEATRQKEAIAYLQHRAWLNQCSLDITLSIAAANTQALALNQRVMERNEDIVAFNHKYIQENTEWLHGGIKEKLASVSAAAVSELLKETSTVRILSP
jgi:hypothetical protein